MLVCLLVLFACAWLVEGEKSAKMKLESRVTQLLEWSSKRSIITLSSDKLNTYARSKPRNYSIVAMFTALNAQRQCSVCKDAHDEFKVLADSWRFSQQYTSQVFFVMVDIDEDGMDAFQQLHLTTAPTYFHFPPTGKRKPEDKFDIARYGYQAEQLAKWVAERTEVHISVMRPPSYTLIFIAIPAMILATIVGYMKRENLHMLYDTRYWAVGAMLWVFIMISGQMWNHIRGPPFAHRNPQTGEMGYFSGTSQYQFIAETYIVALLYGLISAGMVLMNEKFAVFEEMGVQKYTPMIGLAMVVLIFGYLLSIFRMKYQGYPYSFLFR